MAPFTTIPSFLLQLAVILFCIQSSNIILGLPLFFFPSILPSIIVLRRESPLIMWPSQFLCRLLIIPISDLFSSTILSISSLVLCSIQLILSILRHIHISKASNLLISSFLIVHVSDPYNTSAVLFCSITSKFVLIGVALRHYPCLFNRTKSCVWQLPVYLSVSASVSAECVIKLSAPVSVSAHIHFGFCFGR